MFHDIEQNTECWWEMRAGKITGSAISKIMANNGKAFGEPAKKLAVNLAIEQITGKAIPSGYSNAHMERGHEQEPIARALYEEATFCDVLNGGFYDNEITGCSPDGLVDADGVIEIKSVIASVQYATLKRGDIDPAYRWQVSFNLRETGREWIDYVSYCSEFPDGKQLIVHRRTKADLAADFEEMAERIELFERVIKGVRGNILEYKER